MIGALARIIARARQRTAAEIALAIEAAVVLAMADLALRVLPFRQIADRLGQSGRADHDEGPARAASMAQVKAVRQAIFQVRRRLPWHVACLAQAVAGLVMLGRRGVPSTIHFGVSNADGFAAHAWLIAAGEAVTGTEIADRFKPIARIHHST